MNLLVVVGTLECTSLCSGIDSSLIDTSEGLVCGNPLRNIERVERDVAGVVVWKQAAVNDALGIGLRNTKSDLKTLKLASDRRSWICRE